MLSFIRPCSPTTAKTVPAGGAWLHEPKLDGYRIQIAKEGRRVRLYSKAGTERFPSLAEAVAAIPCRSAVIDSELCFRTGIGAGGFSHRGPGEVPVLQVTVCQHCLSTISASIQSGTKTKKITRTLVRQLAHTDAAYRGRDCS